MVIFPVIAAAVSGVFATLLLLRYAHSHALPQLFWGISMAMFAIASLVVAAGVSGGWDATLFRVYWLFGAMLTVPFLALGSVTLLRNRVLTIVMSLAVAAGTLFAFGVVLAAHANKAAFMLDEKQVPRGSAVWGKHTLLHNLADWYSIPAFLVVVGIAFASSRPKVAARLPKSRVRGNWLIAGGVTLVAVGSSTARYGHGAVFSIFLALGAVVMFTGFILTSRQPHTSEEKS